MIGDRVARFRRGRAADVFALVNSVMEIATLDRTTTRVPSNTMRSCPGKREKERRLVSYRTGLSAPLSLVFDSRTTDRRADQ